MMRVPYYNTDSLIKAQINLLPNRNGVLTKRTFVGAATDVVNVKKADSLFWATELDIFYSLNTMNSAANLNAYSMVVVPDSKSNLTVTTFTTTEELPIKQVSIYYYKSRSNLRKIEAFYNQKNPMYKSTRKLAMDFENIYDTITLTHYTVEGKQQMLLGDSVMFGVAGSLKIK